MKNNTNTQITHIDTELLEKVLAIAIRKSNPSSENSPANDTLENDNVGHIIRDTFPLLLSVKEAARIGIPRNKFYDIVNDHPELAVGIQHRKFLDRDKLFAWLDNGGDIQRRKEVA